MNPILERYSKLGENFDPETVLLKTSLRINTLKISKDDFVSRMNKKEVFLKKIPFTKNGYWFESPFPLSSSEEYLQGLFYIQEAASQLPVEVLLRDASYDKNSLIADVASAPGSKTTQLAQMTENKVSILALDSVSPRLDVLEYNLERMGVSSVVTMRKDSRFVDDINLRFDYILLDAPCSGNFCVEKDFFSKRSFADFNSKSLDQKKFLASAIKVLKSGGVMVYSTCSLEPEENELVIDWLLDTFDDLELLDTGLDMGDCGLTNVFGKELNPQVSKTRRFWPHKTGTEGFFIAKIRKA
ncbi:RsmB/NOP family class I SAM-dependent RNA methyltransferase [Candidatus Woesearchaeota archaeon]|nr:RsmB/NOP family class I SAM-dependent RNA methyltransferase [Candidatus Woesearchaeota archaeon]